MDTKVLTILFTDIKGFTNLTSTTSRENLSNLLKQHEKILTPIVEAFGGRVVKMIGDALLAVFESPTNAIHSAIMMQIALKEENEKKTTKFPINIRISINTGEVEVKDNDVYGEAVNVASRLEEITDVNEIFFTDSVFLSMNRNEVCTEEIGYRKFKGIPHEVKIHRVVQDMNEPKFKNLIPKLRAKKYKKKREDDVLSNKVVKPEVVQNKKRSTLTKDLNYHKNQSNNRNKTLNLIIISILMSILLIGGIYFLFLRETPERLFVDFQENIELRNFDKSEVIIKKLYSDYQNSPYTGKAIEMLLENRIDLFLYNYEYEKANEFLINIKLQYPFIVQARYEKKIIKSQADRLYEDGDKTNSEMLYQRLLGDFPNDSNLLMEYDMKFGVEGQILYENDINNKDENKNDVKTDSENNKDTAKDNYKNEPQIDGNQDQDQSINSKTIDIVEFSDQADTRLIQLEELEKLGMLNDINRLRFYYYEILYLSVINNERLEKAIQIFERITQRDNWKELKQIAALDEEIKDVRALSFYSPASRKLTKILSSAFENEIRGQIKNWLSQKNDISLRLNAFYIANELKEFYPAPEFYRENLTEIEIGNDVRAYLDLIDLTINKVYEIIKKDRNNIKKYQIWLTTNKRELENLRRKYQYDTKGIIKTNYINRLSSMIKKIDRLVNN